MKTFWTVLVLAFTSSTLLSSCHQHKKSRYSSAVTITDSGNQQSLGLYAEDRYGYAENKEFDKSERKILFSAYVTISTKTPDTAVAHLEEIAQQFKGYISESGTSRNVLRVKSEFLNEALEAIGQLGEVTKLSKSGQDVSEEYYNYKIRLENAQTARTRYLELLKQAENVEAALLVEKELERVNETIDMLQGQMNRIDHLDQFSTITVYVQEKKKLGLLGYVGVGIYQGVKWLFIRN